MSTESGSSEFSRWKRDAAVALAAGGVMAIVMGLCSFAVGKVTGGEARVLVEAILPTSRFLCSAIMTAAATILALMLTMLGMTINSERQLEEVFFQRVRQIAFYDMLIMLVAVCFLVVHCIPITKSDQIPGWWYSTVYYSMLAISAGLGGAVVAIVIMLYMALKDVIRIFGLDGDEASPEAALTG